MIDPADPTIWNLLKDGLSSIKNGVDIVKTVRDITKDNGTKKKLTASIETAEKSLTLGEAQIAKALGYHLCQCTFPPQIMLSKGHHPQSGMEIFSCSRCGKEDPPKKGERQKSGGGSGSWMG